jgi:DNA-directed RNA polymerase subunit RPC12/RpoP
MKRRSGMRVIKCASCFKEVAKVEKGSLIKKGAAMLCKDCESMRRAVERLVKNKQPDYSDIFGGMFGPKS